MAKKDNMEADNQNVETAVEVIQEPTVSVQQLCDIKGYGKIYNAVIKKKFGNSTFTLSEWDLKLKEAKIINNK